MSKQRPIILAAGGTGGHLFPAQALAEALIARGHRVILATDRRGLNFGGGLASLELHHVQAAGRKPGLKGLIRMVIKQGLGYLQSHWLHLTERPAAIVGFGGYPSLPTVMAALHQGRPVILHEQNAVLGRVNRLLAAKVKAIGTAFPTVERLPAKAAPQHQVGNPVRADIAELHGKDYAAPSEDGPLNLLIIGGSQGATIFSEILPKAVERLPSHLRQRLVITQQARPADIEEARFAYAQINQKVELQTFFTDMPKRLAEAHLVVARAGASTVAEMTAAGRPAILVPYPSAMDNHQHKNAEQMVEQHAAWLMPQDGFTAEALATRLELLLTTPEKLSETAANARNAAHIDAADKLADLVLGLTGQALSHPGAKAGQETASNTPNETPNQLGMEIAP
ncbi:MAG: undecaprenyldiphospho-muramoylpentapeptide beta-N-acetylglucosaminyltransferase [Alphaproteobacteria bacterium]|nr:undecaprenyldiphospho-muramoylpentapeptide beta-N-acetylglucosaminyltransferase [Alphaproteobacteria bacterium SS10]